MSIRPARSLRSGSPWLLASCLARSIAPLALIVTALSIGASPLGAQPVLSGYTALPPTLDGNVDPIEWQAASTATFPLAYCQETHLTTVGVMNDDSFLYLAIQIRDEDFPSIGETDTFFVHFDDDGDGIREVGEEVWQIEHDGTLFEDAHHPGGLVFSLVSDTSTGGTDDLDGAILHGAASPGVLGDYTLELRRPLDSADDAHDPSWQVGDGATFAIGIVESVLPPACAGAFPGPDPLTWIPLTIAGNPSGCPPPTGLVVTTNCVDETFIATWVNPIPYLGIEVTVVEIGSGTAVLNATLGGTETTFTGLVPTLGAHAVRVTGVCSPGVTASVETAVTVAPFPPGTTNAIVDLEGEGGEIDSGLALATALNAIGKPHVHVDDLLTFACRSEMGAGNILWVLLGTFPENHVLTPAEGDVLVELLMGGVSIYIEGGDHWGFDPPTPFRDVDGIAGVAASGNVIPNGDDSLVNLVGLSFDTLDLSPHPGLYDQDSPGNDSTDRLIPTGAPGFAPDQLGTNAGVVWQSGTLGYGVSVLYVPEPSTTFGGGGGDPGKVLGNSFEFGGYCGEEEDVATKISLTLKTPSTPDPEFERGDCNRDGACDISDPVSLLGFLFGGGPLESCAVACDVNGDGVLDLADAISKLAFLFAGGAAPVAPFGVCGPDPAPGALDCVLYDMCS